MIEPSREIEKEFLNYLKKQSNTKDAVVLACVDEVGRGSLAGPVSVGISLIDFSVTDNFPSGLRDSKMLKPEKRLELLPLCKQWVLDVEVGHADNEYIDENGIVAALRRAAFNAYEKLEKKGHKISGVLLDGKHNWWNSDSLFDYSTKLPNVEVKMVIKGDAKCCAIAVASVVAKVERDNLMTKLHEQYSEYNWAKNKGYSSKEHIEALKKYGASVYHRKSWKLPGLK